MSDSEESDVFNEDPIRSFHEIHDEIERCKKNPATSGMFVSGWDDADEDVEEVKDPKGNLHLWHLAGYSLTHYFYVNGPYRKPQS
jgi:hypothetical protein